MSKFDLVKLMWYHNKVRWKVRRLSGAPPLSFKGRGKNLKNYRIYGNTVNGESVGDRTANLFDGIFEQGTVHESSSDGSTYYNVKQNSTEQNRIRTSELFYLGGQGIISWNDSVYDIYIIPFDGDERYKGHNYIVTTYGNNNWKIQSPFTLTEEYIGIAIRYKNVAPVTPSDVDDLNLMINIGDTALPYEPYGYRVPVTVTNGTDTETTNIYLPEQIKMVGDEAEYIDFGEQKQYFADGTSVDVTLPALPTFSGTNTLSVNTEVQPSEVYVEGKIRFIHEGSGENEGE